MFALKDKEIGEAKEENEDDKKNDSQTFTKQTLNDICLRRNWPMSLYMYVSEGDPAHAKRFIFVVRVNTSDKGWTDECNGEPTPSVKKAKDFVVVLLLELLNRNWPMSLYRYVSEGDPAHAKRFIFVVRMGSDVVWCDMKTSLV
uniref:Endoribonuclease Dicer homolog 1 n=1 Tax=Tanacetum cinerariifolium TaxID=118510 RepID=A0A6L2NNH5_TANCI|nr:endoribonuclease Dicer homolog 1 [Tanacetum cinerariifolium]